jgi:crotonobetainyl-CoA:carnitine CoA-transferase CaiB-like acyl-CoA transferase
MGDIACAASPIHSSPCLYHNEANPDPNTSQAVATSIMLALLARTRTGRGQAIEVTMLQGNAWANADEAYDYPGRPPTVLPDEQC